MPWHWGRETSIIYQLYHLGGDIAYSEIDVYSIQLDLHTYIGTVRIAYHCQFVIDMETAVNQDLSNPRSKVPVSLCIHVFRHSTL